MPDREVEPERPTSKGQSKDGSHRVFYTLTKDPDKLSLVLSGVIDKLVEKELLTEAELDEILRSCRDAE